MRRRSAVLILSVLAWSRASHASDVYTFYDAECRRTSGVLVNVDETTVALVDLEGRFVKRERSLIHSAVLHQPLENLPKAAVYCDYVTRAGDGGTSPETVTDNFDGLYATPPTTNWYFVEARCNFSDDSGGTYSEYHQPGNVTQIHKNNEGM